MKLAMLTLPNVFLVTAPVSPVTIVISAPQATLARIALTVHQVTNKKATNVSFELVAAFSSIALLAMVIYRNAQNANRDMHKLLLVVTVTSVLMNQIHTGPIAVEHLATAFRPSTPAQQPARME